MTNEEIKKKASAYLGLARRCGGAAVGTEAVMAEIRRAGASGRTAVILAADASGRTKKQIEDKCTFYGVAHFTYGLTSDEIARAVGKQMTVSAVAVTEGHLASALKGLNDEDGAAAL